jgi:hypothetical protein
MASVVFYPASNLSFVSQRLTDGPDNDLVVEQFASDKECALFPTPYGRSSKTFPNPSRYFTTIQYCFGRHQLNTTMAFDILHDIFTNQTTGVESFLIEMVETASGLYELEVITCWRPSERRSTLLPVRKLFPSYFSLTLRVLFILFFLTGSAC